MKETQPNDSLKSEGAIRKLLDILQNTFLWTFLLGILIITLRILGFIEGEQLAYWGFPVPFIGEIVLFLVGIALCVLSFRALRRGEGKPVDPTYTDEDVKEARKKLDAMYLREHGSLPDRPKEAKDKPPHTRDDMR